MFVCKSCRVSMIGVRKIKDEYKAMQYGACPKNCKVPFFCESIYTYEKPDNCSMCGGDVIEER